MHRWLASIVGPVTVVGFATSVSAQADALYLRCQASIPAGHANAWAGNVTYRATPRGIAQWLPQAGAYGNVMMNGTGWPTDWEHTPNMLRLTVYRSSGELHTRIEIDRVSGAYRFESTNFGAPDLSAIGTCERTAEPTAEAARF